MFSMHLHWSYVSNLWKCDCREAFKHNVLHWLDIADQIWFHLGTEHVEDVHLGMSVRLLGIYLKSRTHSLSLFRRYLKNFYLAFYWYTKSVHNFVALNALYKLLLTYLFWTQYTQWTQLHHWLSY